MAERANNLPEDVGYFETYLKEDLPKETIEMVQQTIGITPITKEELQMLLQNHYNKVEELISESLLDIREKKVPFVKRSDIHKSFRQKAKIKLVDFGKSMVNTAKRAQRLPDELIANGQEVATGFFKTALRKLNSRLITISHKIDVRLGRVEEIKEPENYIPAVENRVMEDIKYIVPDPVAPESKNVLQFNQGSNPGKETKEMQKSSDNKGVSTTSHENKVKNIADYQAEYLSDENKSEVVNKVVESVGSKTITKDDLEHALNVYFGKIDKLIAATVTAEPIKVQENTQDDQTLGPRKRQAQFKERARDYISDMGSSLKNTVEIIKTAPERAVVNVKEQTSQFIDKQLEGVNNKLKVISKKIDSSLTESSEKEVITSEEKNQEEVIKEEPKNGKESVLNNVNPNELLSKSTYEKMLLAIPVTRQEKEAFMAFEKGSTLQEKVDFRKNVLVDMKEQFAIDLSEKYEFLEQISNQDQKIQTEINKEFTEAALLANVSNESYKLAGKNTPVESAENEPTNGAVVEIDKRPVKQDSQQSKFENLNEIQINYLAERVKFGEAKLEFDNGQLELNAEFQNRDFEESQNIPYDYKVLNDLQQIQEQRSETLSKLAYSNGIKEWEMSETEFAKVESLIPYPVIFEEGKGSKLSEELIQAKSFVEQQNTQSKGAVVTINHREGATKGNAVMQEASAGRER